MKLKLSGFEAKLDILDLTQGAIAALTAAQFGLPLSEIALAGIGGAFKPTLSLK